MNELTENNASYSDISIEYPNISMVRLRELGRKQGHITYSDIIDFFPDAENDIDFLSQIYTSIRSVGILLSEDTSSLYSPEEESASEDDENEGHSSTNDDYRMKNIETDNLVGLYFSDAGHFPLLTADDEVDLAKRIERGLHAREEISNCKPRNNSQCEELQDLIDDGVKAVNHLISANSRLVISIAKKYIHRGVPFLDLIQEGNIGLMRAVKKFDYRRGYKFGTYATWWIRQAVTRALDNQSRTIRLPVHRSAFYYQVLRISRLLEQRFGRKPDIVELSKELGVAPEKIQQIFKDAQYTLSLDMPTSFEEDSVLGDNIEDHDIPDFDDLVNYSMLQDILEEIFEKLPPREVQILKMRFGLLYGKVHTLHEVGLRLGVSRERIRQIEAQAFRRLRRPEIIRQLQSYRNQLNP